MERETTDLPVTDWKRLTNEFTTPAGLGHPANVGNTGILLASLDAGDDVVDGSSLILLPGESRQSYLPPSDVDPDTGELLAKVIVGSAIYPPDSDTSPDDVIRLEYDLPVG